MAPDNPLSPASILSGMAAALPTHPKGDTSSDLSSSYEALALFTHAVMTALGFRLVSLHEDPSSSSSSQPDADECRRLAPRLPPQWNASFNAHSFVYAHAQSAMRFVMKIDRLGSKAEIRGLAIGHERICRVEVAARDYISAAALPVRIALGEDGEEAEGRGGDLEEKLGRVFISKERMSDLANLLKVQIIQRLLPSLQKEGYEETNPDDRAAAADADRAGRIGAGARQPPQLPDPLPQPAQPNPYPVVDPLAAPPPRRPIPAGDFPPPDFEDEYEINRPPRGGRAGGGPAIGPFGGPGRSPFNIGHDDLHPPGLGPHDPLRPSFAGGRIGPFGGGRGGVGGMGGGGMHPTFDDPLFQGPDGGEGGEGGFDPQAPPGARWDPIGPGGAPRFGGGRPGGRGNPFGGGGGGGGFGGFGGGDII